MSSYEGTIVLNYRLIRQLGEGGFGMVYLAEHVELGRKAACKILRRELVGHGDAVERFFREARAACAIGHRAIVDIENFGRLSDGEPFYLMEYIPGESLARRVERGALQLAEALAVFDPIASALAAAHASGIIHRDIKPDNIMVRDTHGKIVEVKLLDFGIAKLLASAPGVQALSQSSATIGTPLFMSPEQARDASRVDARTDIYSFAATVYAALAGRPPLLADSLANLVLKLQLEAPVPLRQLAPHVPAALEAAVMQCLEKEPERRPPSMTAAWGAMRDALVAAVGAGDAHGFATTTASERPAPRARRRTWPVVVAVLAVAAVAGGVVIAALGFTGAREARPAVVPPREPAVVAMDASAGADAAAPPAQAAPVATLSPDAGSVGASPRPPSRKPGAKHGDPPPRVEERPPPPAPAAACDEGRFTKVAREDQPSDADVQAALAQLKQCKASFTPEKYQQLQRALLRKL